MIKRRILACLLVFIVALVIFSFPSNADVLNQSIVDDLEQNEFHKISKSLQQISSQNKTHIIIQVKNKNVSSKIKNGKVKNSLDKNLLFAEVYGDEIVDLAKDSDVIKIWPDLKTQVFLNESVGQIGAGSFWDSGFNGSGVKIAVLDTGVSSSHEMFGGRVILSKDFSGSGGVGDVFGHGTHVAGIAAGNGLYKGVAPGALLMRGKVLGDDGSGQLSWLI
ncbi:MAG: S8 family serine peptidase, partial [Nanoarchaeota archaeon]|nr:S8 family serine peptidase [Nanoarchaeota archaeon]